MQPELPIALAKGYCSGSQRARVMTEPWVAAQAYCPACGGDLMRHTANKPVADFFCPSCAADYELKSKKGRFVTKAADGAYDTMISRINGQNAPSFFFLGHDGVRVHTFFTVPAHYFTPDIIEKRRPLRPTAKRAGWVGCWMSCAALRNSVSVSFRWPMFTDLNNIWLHCIRKIATSALKFANSCNTSGIWGI